MFLLSVYKKMNNEEKQKEKKDIKSFIIHIPDCCREGRDDCKHGVKKIKPQKQNVGL